MNRLIGWLVWVPLLWLAGCAGLHQESAALSSAQQPETSFFFAQITDLHVGELDDLDRLRSVVRELNQFAKPLECVVVTGDIFSDDIQQTALREEALSVLKELRYPVHYAAGNHDVETRPEGESWQLFETHFSPLRHTVDHQGVRFVFPAIMPLGSRWHEEAKTGLAWLETTLAAASNQPALVFNHIPSCEDFYGNTFHPGWPEALQRSWETTLHRYPVKAVLCGHFHRDELHWVGQVPLYVSASVAGNWGRQASYRIYRYAQGRLDYFTQYTEPWPRARGNFTAAQASSEGDRNCAAAAVDGHPGTRWESRHQSDPEWLVVTLAQPRDIDEIFIDWETAAARAYDVQTSPDGTNWTTVATVSDGQPDENRTLRFEPQPAAMIRIHGRERATEWGYSIREIEVSLP